MGDWEAHNLLQGTGCKMQDLGISHPLGLTPSLSPALCRESEILHTGTCVLSEIRKDICTYYKAAVDRPL